MDKKKLLGKIRGSAWFKAQGKNYKLENYSLEGLKECLAEVERYDRILAFVERNHKKLN